MIRSKPHLGLLLLGALFLQGASAAVADNKAGSPGKPAATTASVPSARVLGITESALEFCNRTDPSASVKLELQKRKLVRGLSQPALEKIRKSDEYRQAYAAESDFVAKVDEHNAKRICAQALAKSR